MLSPGKPFRPSPMFTGKADTYPTESPFRSFKKLVNNADNSIDNSMTLYENIELVLKSFPRTNTLAYFARSLMMKKKGFIKKFSSHIFQQKCFSLASVYSQT